MMETTSTQRKFTWRELSSLNRKDNAHVAFRGKVYDVSGFLTKHPGGSEQLLDAAGRDITQVFQSYHKPGTSKLIAEKSKYVGELVDNEMPTFCEESEFYETVKKRVAQTFKLAQIDSKICYFTFCRYALLCILALVFWYLGIKYHSEWICCFFAAASGFCLSLVTLTLCHDGNHFAITHEPWVWKMISLIGDSLHGLSSRSWIYTHNLSHHIYTNVDEVDPDVLTVNDGPDWYRLRQHQYWVSRYIYQPLYMPLLYSIFFIRRKIHDFETLLSPEKFRLNPPSFSQLLSFFVPKAIHFLVRCIIPFFLMPFSTLLLINLVCDTIASLHFIFVGQLPHVNTETEWPLPLNKIHWAEMQVATTQDYATDSWVWTFLTGAANHQVAHHLCPSILQTYYPLITPIIKQTCSEFGIQYHYVPSAWNALCSHLQFLRQMGKKPK